jgi:hypothetical protein
MKKTLKNLSVELSLAVALSAGAVPVMAAGACFYVGGDAVCAQGRINGNTACVDNYGYAYGNQNAPVNAIANHYACYFV